MFRTGTAALQQEAAADQGESQECGSPEVSQCTDVSVDTSQVAAINLHAGFLGIHAYLEATGRMISPTGWRFPEQHSREMCARLREFQTSRGMVEALLETRSTWADRGPILSVAVADTPEPILAKTREWPDFEVDEGGLRAAMGGGPSLGVAVRCHLTLPSWEGFQFETRGSVYPGDLLRLTAVPKSADPYSDTIPCVVSADAFGYPTLHYEVENAFHVVRVRLTDLTEPKEGRATPSYDGLIASHLEQQAWPQDTRYAGAEFQSFRLPTEASMRHCLGAQNGNWQVAAVQAGGHVEINKQTPLNLDVKSVMVVRYRSFEMGPEAEPTYLDFSHQEAGDFVNLVEVDIRSHESASWCRLFDGLYNRDHAVS